MAKGFLKKFLLHQESSGTNLKKKKKMGRHSHTNLFFSLEACVLRVVSKLPNGIGSATSKIHHSVEVFNNIIDLK